MELIVKCLASTILTGIIYILGGYDIALTTLLIMIVLDFITGISKAIWNKKLNSEIGVKGILKKLGYLVVVSISVILDKILGNHGSVRNIVIYFFVANEGISILENWGSMGLPLPPKLIDILEQLKNKE